MTAPVVLTLGEAMGLADTDVAGSLITSRSLTLSFGGAESNVAIGLSRLGVRTRWFSKLGDDAIGRMILRELRAEGVDVRAARSPDHPTGFMLKERLGGERASIWYYRVGSAASTLGPDDIPADLFDDVGLVHLTGIDLVLSERMRSTALAVIDAAHRSGASVSFDVNHRDRLMSAAHAAPRYREVAARADFVFAGEDEARLLVDCASADPAALTAALGEEYGAEIVLKRGGAGALAHARDGRRVGRAAVPVDVVDAVGAGDAFVAGYLAERVIGRDVDAALATANAAGAHACTIRGDWEGTPSRDDLAHLSRSEGVRR